MITSPVSICEIGCGGGDNLFAIHKYCMQKNIEANFIGIDMNPECIAFAQQQYPKYPANGSAAIMHVQLWKKTT